MDGMKPPADTNPSSPDSLDAEPMADMAPEPAMDDPAGFQSKAGGKPAKAPKSGGKKAVWIVLIVLAALIGLAAGYVWGGGLDDDDQAQAQVQQLQQQIDDLNQQLEEATDTVNDEVLTQKDQEIADLTAANEDLQETVDEQKQKIDDLQDQLDQIEDETDDDTQP